MQHSTIWIYPWDLLDEGIPEVLAALRTEAGVKAISLATSYHSVEHFRPHLSGRKYFVARDAALYFQPQRELYRETLIEPHVSPLVGPSNPLEAIARACEEAGMELISWTVCLHNSTLGRQYPLCTVRNVFDDSYTCWLCPAHPEVRRYLRALVRDLSRNYPLAALELESLHYGGRPHYHTHAKVGVDLGPVGDFLLGLCFCDQCVDLGQAHGVDTKRLANTVADLLEEALATGRPLAGEVADFIAEQADLAAYVAMREEVVTSLVQEVKEASRVPISFLSLGDRWTTGVNLPRVAHRAHRIEILAYTADTAALERQIQSVGNELGSRDRLGVGLQAYPPAAPDEATLVRNVQAAVRQGVRFLSFYHYGIMPRPNLAWIRRALQESG
jgi:hypothetical protein